MLESSGSQHLAFNRLITQILSRFASGSIHQIDQDICESLREIAQFVGVDYTFVVLVAPDALSWSVAYEWCAPTAPSQQASYQEVPMGTFEWSERILLAGEVLLLNRLDEVPNEGAVTRGRFASLRFKSTLQVPMHGTGGKVVGCVALCSLERESIWKQCDVMGLRLVSQAITTALERAKVECELRAALAEVERLTERLQAEKSYLLEEISDTLGFDEIIGEGAELREVLAQVECVATTDASVLLLGETGTGKELLARAIHDRSRRSGSPLVKVNLAALPASLIESELFGHRKGAFTGATADKVGRFHLADGGTLFLDEIGELSPEVQVKLLRVLQEGEFERIGSGESHKVDVRIVAATNRDLHLAMERKEFRSDLFFRLAVFPIQVPPLRSRREDIPSLAMHFLRKKRARLGNRVNQIPEATMRRLQEYHWPGNIRELENVIERAMILSPGSVLRDCDLPVVDGARKRTIITTNSPLSAEEIRAALEAANWKIKGTGNAAERLGMKASTLRYRMRSLGIKRPEQ